MSHSAPSLSTQQWAAVRLLARGHGTTRVCQRLGLSRNTIARWKHQPRFAAELRHFVGALNRAALRLRPASRMHRYILDRARA